MLCAPGTPEIYAQMPWRILEVLDAFEPFVTTQPRCAPDYEAIADLVPLIEARPLNASMNCLRVTWRSTRSP